MKKALLGKKVGMTQVFDKEGKAIPVTVIQVGPNIIIQKKTLETDGYNAIKVGFEDIKENKLIKPIRGQFEKVKLATKRYIRELRLENVDSYEVGQEINADVFAEGDRVDISGVSKGKGTAGVIKRYKTSRGPMSHGSHFHRRVGSIGASASPGKTFKGQKLPGRMGNEKTTIQNIAVVKVDAEKNYILVKGGVPGIRGSLVMIKDTVKA
ncbi:MAG: 50S ribosomal protein L3 [Firmicutes bacterium]|nr:50S ribosomal protein L3 [Bacillota bacterium]